MVDGADEMGLGESAVAARAPRGTGPSETPVLLVWALAVILGAVFVIGRSEHRSLHDPVQRLSRGEITAASPEAMFRRANLAGALARVRDAAQPGEKVQLIRVETGLVDATLVTPATDARREVKVDLTGTPTTRSDFQSDSFGVPLASVHPGAPVRLLAAVRRRVPQGAVDSFVFSAGSPGNPASWTLKLTSATVPLREQAWVADGRGLGVHRQGESAPVSRATTRARLRIASCFQHARTQDERTRCLR